MDSTSLDVVYLPQTGATWPAWIQAIGSLVALVIAIGVPIWLQHVAKHRALEERQKRTQAHWDILRVEVDFCLSKANDYINRTVAAPLYRMSTAGLARSLPILAADGAISADDARVLLAFYAWAEDINRGLEKIGEIMDLQAQNMQAGRINQKCIELRDKYFPDVDSALRARTRGLA
jgi:hypothetical protein